jgi:hypothetical protein
MWKELMYRLEILWMASTYAEAGEPQMALEILEAYQPVSSSFNPVMLQDVTN